MLQGTNRRPIACSAFALLIAAAYTTAVAADEPAKGTAEIKQQIIEVVKQRIQEMRAFNAEMTAARYHSNLRWAGQEDVPRPGWNRIAYWKNLFGLRTFREIWRKLPEDFWVFDQAQLFTKAECEKHAHSVIRSIGEGMMADEYLIYIPTKPSLKKAAQEDDEDDDDLTTLLPAIAEVYRKIDGKWLVVGVPLGELDVNEDPESVEDTNADRKDQEEE